MEKESLNVNCKIKIAGFVLSCLFIFTACSLLPSPDSIIMAPELEEAAWSKFDKDASLLIKEFLPLGTAPLMPANPKGAAPVEKIDVDGDNKDELAIIFKNGEEKGAVILKQSNGKWYKIFDERQQASGIDWAAFADITGDGLPEFILGWAAELPMTNGLDIFSWQKGGMKKIFNTAYDRLQLGDLHARKGIDGKTELLIRWKVEAVNKSGIVILGGFESQLAHVEGDYPDYFKYVVRYYEDIISKYPDDGGYLYHLAEEQIKADMFAEALESIKMAEFLVGYTDESQPIPNEVVKARALIGLGKYAEARDICNKIIRDSANIADISIRQTFENEGYLYLGQCYIGEKNYDKAREAFLKAYDIIKEMGETQWAAVPVKKALQELDALQGLKK